MPSPKNIKKYHLSLFLISIISLINIVLYRFTSLAIINLNLKYFQFFYVWLACLLLGFLLSFKYLNINLITQIKKIVKNDKKEIIIFGLLFVIYYFSFLESLDFVFIGDSLRESGYNALAIFNKQNNFDPFSLGSYSGYGNLVPVIGAIFINFLGSTATAVRLPTVLMALLTIALLYLFLRSWQNKKTAIFATILLIFSSRFLHYSRSEIVILSPGLFIIIYLFLIFLIEKYKRGWLLLGLTIGLSFHFYVATRPIALLILIYLFINQCFLHKFQIVKIIKKFVCFFVGLIIGLGPSINQLSLKATGAGDWLFKQDNFVNLNLIGKISYTIKQYFLALANNFFSNTSPIHYPQTTPILEFPLNLLTALGIIYVLKKEKKFSLSTMIVVLIFSLPLFLQVFSSDISQDQRNLANLVLGTIISAILLNKISNKNVKKNKFNYFEMFIYCLFFFNVLSTTKAYFFDKISYKNFINNRYDFSLQAICNHIYQNKNKYLIEGKKLLIIYDQPELLHIQEKMIYCAFPVNIAMTHFSEYDSNLYDKQVITYFVSDYGLNIDKATKYTTNCHLSFWPNYACSLENSDYYFLIINN